MERSIEELQNNYITNIVEGRSKLLDLYRCASGASGIKRKLPGAQGDAQKIIKTLKATNDGQQEKIQNIESALRNLDSLLEEESKPIDAIKGPKVSQLIQDFDSAIISTLESFGISRLNTRPKQRQLFSQLVKLNNSSEPASPSFIKDLRLYCYEVLHKRREGAIRAIRGDSGESIGPSKAEEQQRFDTIVSEMSNLLGISLGNQKDPFIQLLDSNAISDQNMIDFSNLILNLETSASSKLNLSSNIELTEAVEKLQSMLDSESPSKEDLLEELKDEFILDQVSDETQTVINNLNHNSPLSEITEVGKLALKEAGLHSRIAPENLIEIKHAVQQIKQYQQILPSKNAVKSLNDSELRIFIEQCKAIDDPEIKELIQDVDALNSEFTTKQVVNIVDRVLPKLVSKYDAQAKFSDDDILGVKDFTQDEIGGLLDKLKIIRNSIEKLKIRQPNDQDQKFCDAIESHFNSIKAKVEPNLGKNPEMNLQIDQFVDKQDYVTQYFLYNKVFHKDRKTQTQNAAEIIEKMDNLIETLQQPEKINSKTLHEVKALFESDNRKIKITGESEPSLENETKLNRSPKFKKPRSRSGSLKKTRVARSESLPKIKRRPSWLGTRLKRSESTADRIPRNSGKISPSGKKI